MYLPFNLLSTPSSFVTHSLETYLICFFATQYDLLHLLLVAKRVAVHVRFQADIDAVNECVIRYLIQHGAAQIADALYRLGENDSVEVQVVSPLRETLLVLLTCGFGSRLYNALICHAALLHEAVSEGLRGNDLRLGPLLRALPLLIHLADVVEQLHVEGVAALSATEPVDLNDIARLQVEVMH